MAVLAADRLRRAGLVLGIWLVVAFEAHAGECPRQPAGWRPQVRVTARNTLLERPVLTAEVWLHLEFCSHDASGVVTRPRVRFVVAEGSGVGAVLAARRQGETLVVALPGPGAFVLRVEAVGRPRVQPAEVRVRVVDPGQTLPVTLRLVPSPLDAVPATGGSLLLERDGLKRWVRVRARRGSWGSTPIRLEHGPHAVAWHERNALVDVRAAGVATVTLPGSDLRVDADGLPVDGQEYELVLQPEGRRAPLRTRFEAWGAAFHDVPPGAATLTLRSARRVDSQDRVDLARVWKSRARVALQVAPQTRVALAWSVPNLLAGRPPNPGPWTEVVGVPGRTTSAAVTLKPAFSFALRQGRAILLDDGVHQWADRPGATASSLALRPELGRGPTMRPDPPWSLQAWRADAWAWAEGGDRVLFRNGSGFYAEKLPLYVQNRPYPCGVAGVAVVAADDVVAVGVCRGHVPLDVPAPTDGFIAERQGGRWRLRGQRYRPLRAVALGPDGVVVAVGDGGQVAWRRRGGWSIHKNGDASLVAVAALASRTVARTTDGRLVDLPHDEGVAPGPIALGSDRGAPRTALAHCLVPDGVVVLHPALGDRYQGGSRPTVPARVILHHAQGERVLHDGRGGWVHALACEGDRVALLVAGESGALRVERREGRRLAR